MKVELGAGQRKQDGWLAVDLTAHGTDVIADAAHLPFADGAVSEMRAVDVLEHLSYRETPNVLAEWARVCKHGARLYVQVPDADTIMRWYVSGDARLCRIPDELHQGQISSLLMGAAWRLLGGHADGRYVAGDDDWRWNAHYALFSQGSLQIALRLAAFHVERIERNDHPNLLAWAVRD